MSFPTMPPCILTHMPLCPSCPGCLRADNPCTPHHIALPRLRVSRSEQLYKDSSLFPFFHEEISPIQPKYFCELFRKVNGRRVDSTFDVRNCLSHNSRRFCQCGLGQPVILSNLFQVNQKFSPLSNVKRRLHRRYKRRFCPFYSCLSAFGSIQKQ